MYIVLIKIHYKADFKRDLKKLKKKVLDSKHLRYFVYNIQDFGISLLECDFLHI